MRGQLPLFRNLSLLGNELDDLRKLAAGWAGWAAMAPDPELSPSDDWERETIRPDLVRWRRERVASRERRRSPLLERSVMLSSIDVASDERSNTFPGDGFTSAASTWVDARPAYRIAGLHELLLTDTVTIRAIADLASDRACTRPPLEAADTQAISKQPSRTIISEPVIPPAFAKEFSGSAMCPGYYEHEGGQIRCSLKKREIMWSTAW